jgi:hypothetical protein
MPVILLDTNAHRAGDRNLLVEKKFRFPEMLLGTHAHCPTAPEETPPRLNQPKHVREPLIKAELAWKALVRMNAAAGFGGC